MSSNNIKVDAKDFEKLSNKLMKLASSKSASMAAFESYVNDTHYYLKDYTPVQTGKLRSSWKNPVYQKAGGLLQAVIENDCDYAIPVNDGHVQEPGRYVPQINARLVRSYVDGRHFVENAIDYMNSSPSNQKYQTEIVRVINGVLKK